MNGLPVICTCKIAEIASFTLAKFIEELLFFLRLFM